MRGAVKSKLTGRDLNQWVTLLAPQVVEQRTERGVFVPGAGQPTFRRIRMKAMYMEKPGKEGLEERLQTDTRMCTWTIVWRPGLDTKHQVEDREGVVWNVRGIREIPKRAFWVLECTARPEQ